MITIGSLKDCFQTDNIEFGYILLVIIYFYVQVVMQAMTPGRCVFRLMEQWIKTLNIWLGLVETV